MKVICKNCGAVVIAESNDFCPECGTNLKDAVIPENEKKVQTYSALKNFYDGQKRVLIIILIVGGILLISGILPMLLR